jgi:hypothetical protein
MSAQNVQVLLKVAEKLNVYLEVDVEFCRARGGNGCCYTDSEGSVVIKLTKLDDERLLAHELVHAFQRTTGEYLWVREDLEFWSMLEDVPLDIEHMDKFEAIWQKGDALGNPCYTRAKYKKEYLAWYVGCANNGMSLFWRIAKEVLASR